jgi:capsular polysaccharide biosynthesis protein
MAAAPLKFLPGTSLGFGPPRGIEPSTEAWLKRVSAGTFRELSAARRTVRSMPVHADAPIARRFAAMRRGRIKRRAVAELAGVRFWGTPYGCVITPDDRILRDLSPTFADFVAPRPQPSRHDAFSRFKLPPLERVSGRLAAINTYGHDNFHHWLLDSLPGFGLLREAGVDFGSVDAFLLQTRMKAFHVESLERLGIPKAKVISVSHSRHLHPDRLIVPTFSEPGRQPDLYDYSPQGIELVRALFLDRRTPSPVNAAKIVISREKTTTRRLLDGERIHDRLRREGFVKVCLEDFTVAQQAAVFRQARTVIMPTGGGLANVVFCEPGTRLIEVFSPAYLPTFCLPLTQALGVDYVALVGDSTAGNLEHSDIGNRLDIRLGEERLLAFAAG